jgi:small-conductance mechanosensitive channel
MEFLEELSRTERFLATVLVIIVFTILFRILKMYLHKSIHNAVTYYKVKTSIGYFLFIISIIMIITIWVGIQFSNASTYLGLASAGIAFALRDIFLNLASWLLIIWKKPFTIGDRIQVGTVAGDVIDQNVFYLTLMEIKNWVNGEQSTGRIIHVPNSKVFSEPVANYSKGFQYIWNEITVNLTIDSNWKKAKTLLQSILTEQTSHLTEEAVNKVHNASRKYMIYYNKLTPTVYTNVANNQVQLSLRYLCEPRNRRNSEHEIWEQILTTFKEEQDLRFSKTL